MSKQTVTRYLKLTVPKYLAGELDRLLALAADYENLSPLESAEYDDLSAEVLAPEYLALVPEDNSIVCWLPVDGTVPPEQGKGYLFTDGSVTVHDYGYNWPGGFGLYHHGHLDITHYAELPVKR